MTVDFLSGQKGTQYFDFELNVIACLSQNMAKNNQQFPCIYLIFCGLIISQVALYLCRILIIFRDGLITLWDIRESKSIRAAGGNVLQSLYHEKKQVTSACWVCPVGSKVAVGYNNGEIFIWGVPSTPNVKAELSSEFNTQTTPICKLNLGYKLEKNPIASLKWVYADGKAGRLYIMGDSDSVSANLLQVLERKVLNSDACQCIKYAKHHSAYNSSIYDVNSFESSYFSYPCCKCRLSH